ncbi:MAG: TrmB family transcriptional regulator [Deltaproteobacteria bacterium]|nr:TrmB family transcriptional regulator [Deltaproteobacteria bacterium]
MKLGLSEYEARAYVSLLAKNPATAYEIGKHSGVPTSKVYEVLKKLHDKGSVLVLDEGKTRRYVPVEPEELLDRHKDLVESLRDDLSDIRGRKELSYIWNITDYDYLIDRLRRMIDGASRELLVSIWEDEMALIAGYLKASLERRVKAAVVHFGLPAVRLGQVFTHPIEDTIYHEKGGRGVALVADSREVLIGTIFPDGSVEGAWSANKGFVTLAEDYIKHDIYITKIVKRFDGPLKKRFGAGYAKLRDVFTDEDLR